jgi:hypothetical protein
VWRHQTRMEALSPPVGGACRAALGGSSVAEQYWCALVPSSSKRWLSLDGAPVRVRLGRGAAHVHAGDARRLGRSQSGGPIKA